MGTAEECNIKIQKSPEKRKDLEQHIKNMAQNYVPERKNEGKGKNKGRAKQERKNRESIKRTTEISNISSNSAKSKIFFSQPLPKPTARGSLNIHSIVSCLQTGENKVIKKSILKSTTSDTSSIISVHQDKRTPNAQEKTFTLSQKNANDSDGCFCKPLKIEREKFPHRPAEIISGKTNQASKCLDLNPILHATNNQEVKSNNTKYSAEYTVVSTQLPMVVQSNSTAVSGFVVLHEQNDHMGDQDNPKSKLLGDSERNWSQKSEQNTCDSVSEKNSEYDQVYFENFQQAYIPGIVNQEYNSLDCYSLPRLRDPENSILASAMVSKPIEHAACVQKDQNNDPVYLVKHGSSFLSELCKDMDQDSSANLTMNSSVTTDENEENQSMHSFLNPPFSLNELGDKNIVQDPASCIKFQDITLEESSDQQLIYTPQKMPGGSSCSELLSDCVSESLQQQSSGSLVIVPPILEKLESEHSEEEFTMSSASSSLSAVSLTKFKEQRNGHAKDDDNTDSSIEMVPEKDLKVMLENGMWQDIILQDIGKQR
ncbi:hypothetical protein JD844_019796 [Phrynosoma platyrhinos]|uniref:Uncharacterized protein n=1 Tax=Phrynosoma platyrhinos TaxID=52577 RepID=A0ABQ7TRD7_PHRPL|nr:hypothetical protein JD844_019796 [Phrynosoma platyrhinos]